MPTTGRRGTTMENGFNLPSVWNLPEALVVRFGNKAGRQRIMLHEGHVLLVLHKVPLGDTNERDAVLFWREPKEGKWETTTRGNGFFALKELIQEYDTAVDALDDELDEADNAKEYFEVIHRTAPVSRSAKHLHEVLQNTREALKEDKEIITLRDETYGISRSCELLLDDAKHKLDYEVARQTEEEAEQGAKTSLAAHRLNVLVALFLPITAIATIFGANLTTGLEAIKSPLFFWGVMAVGLLIGFILKGIISRK